MLRQKHAIPEAMNQLDLSPLFDLLTSLDIPLIPAFFTNETGDYVEQLANVKRVLGIDIFVDLEVVPDPRNKSRNVIYLDAAEMSSSFPTYVSLYRRNYFAVVIINFRDRDRCYCAFVFVGDLVAQLTMSKYRQ